MTKVNDVHQSTLPQTVQQPKNKEQKKIGTVFSENETLTRAEKRELRKNDGIDLSRREIRKYSAMEGGEAFLDKYINAKGENIQAVRKEMALKFFAGDNEAVNENTMADLKRFGLTDDEVNSYLAFNKLNHEKPIGIITPEAVSGNKEQTVRVKTQRDEQGNVTGIMLYEGEEGLSGAAAEPTRQLTKEGKYFTDNNGNYYKYNAEQNVLSDVSGKVNAEKAETARKEGIIAQMQENGVEVPAQHREAFDNMSLDEKVAFLQETKIGGLEEQLKGFGVEVVPDEFEGKTAEEKIEILEQRVDAQVEKKRITDAFSQKGLIVTVDETDSKARLQNKEVWDTRLVVYKKPGFDEETGLPNKISIVLGDNYGFAEHVTDDSKRVMYQDLTYDKENGVYVDKSGMRKFAANVDSEGKITLKEELYENHDQKINDFVKTNTEVANKMIGEYGAQIAEAQGTAHDRSAVDAAPWFEQKDKLQDETISALETQLADELGQPVAEDDSELDGKTKQERIDILQGRADTAQDERIEGLTKKAESYGVELTDEQKAKIDAEPSRRNKVEIAKGFVFDAQKAEIEKLNEKGKAMHIGITGAANESIEDNDALIKMLQERIKRAEENDEKFAEVKTNIDEQWAVLTGAKDSGVKNIRYNKTGIQFIDLNNGNMAAIEFDENGGISRVYTRLAGGPDSYTDFAISEYGISIDPDKDNSTKNNVILDRTGNVYGNYTLEDAVALVKDLGIEIKPQKPEQPAE